MFGRKKNKVLKHEIYERKNQGLHIISKLNGFESRSRMNNLIFRHIIWENRVDLKGVVRQFC